MTKQTKKQKEIIDEIAMEEQPRTMPYEESVYFLKNGLAILLKGARKDLTVTDLAIIIASILDVSEYEEFAGLLLRLSKHEEKE